MKDLINHLVSGLENDGVSKVRAFYVWIGAQDLLNFDWNEDVNEGSALYQLLLVHSGAATLNDLLANMCR